MHLYDSKVSDFVKLAQKNEIAAILKEKFPSIFDQSVSPQEYSSWNESLRSLATVIDDVAFENSHIIIEFKMPLNSKRCDAILVGQGLDNTSNAVVIELKGWEAARESAISESVAIGTNPRPHPSAQVKGYCEYLKYYHEAFTENNLQIQGCSFLHNMTDKKSIALLTNPALFGLLPNKYPIFTKKDFDDFRKFLKSKVGNTKTEDLHKIIIEGKIKPSTKLLDVLEVAIKSNFKWKLLAEQQLAFNTVTTRVKEGKNSLQKSIVIVKGGPGTGKSVLAIQLLAYAAEHKWRVAHATGSKAFKTVLQGQTESFADHYLKEIYNVNYKKDLPVKEIFSAFADIAKLNLNGQEIFDLVVADESHRLWDFRRDRYRTLSEVPMIEELIKTSKVIAFFLDDNQAVRANEIGTSTYIKEHAERLGVNVDEIDLNTQFRCAGSKSYTDWVDFAMGFNQKNSLEWKKFGGYDFRIVDSMSEMQRLLDSHRSQDTKCRFVAGFCWGWSPIQKNGVLKHDVKDTRFGDWSAPWNEKTEANNPLENMYYKWNTDDSYYEQVGSIYSVQGFEFDYIGLIFGEDLIWRNGKWTADLRKNKDTQAKLKEGEEAVEKLRNIYRVLMTRGMKGTYVFFLDSATKNYFKQLLSGSI